MPFWFEQCCRGLNSVIFPEKYGSGRFAGIWKEKESKCVRTGEYGGVIEYSTKFANTFGRIITFVGVGAFISIVQYWSPLLECIT